MTEEIAGELLKIQQYTEGLRKLVKRAEEDAPQRAEGSDPSGSVTMEMDSTGLPQSIWVDKRWNQRIKPSAFVGAVQEAASAAINDRLTTWTEALHQSGWQRDFERFQSNPAEAAEPVESPSIPPALSAGSASQPAPRTLDLVTEDMIAAVDRSEQIAAEVHSPKKGEGSDSSGRLSVTVSRTGGFTCSADESWVSQQTAARLMTALSEAVDHAKQRLAALEAEDGKQQNTQLDGILAEAMALLNDPRRAASD